MEFFPAVQAPPTLLLLFVTPSGWPVDHVSKLPQHQCALKQACFNLIFSRAVQGKMHPILVLFCTELAFRSSAASGRTVVNGTNATQVSISTAWGPSHTCHVNQKSQSVNQYQCDENVGH